MMKTFFDVRNLYWIAGGDETRAWSSAAALAVPGC